MVLRTQAAARPLDATSEIIGRFLHYLVIGDGCWEWPGKIDPHGYGRLSIGTMPLLAHRVSWAVFHGSLPARIHVLHHCDNPPCVRPDHLFLGTHRDNMADAVRKGRLRHPGKSGSTNPLAKLNDSIVAEARRRHRDGVPIKRMAAEYGVSSSTLGKAVRGRKWQHVTEPCVHGRKRAA